MKNEETLIGHREALTLLVTLMSGKVFLSLPRNMALLGDSAGWLIVLFSGLWSLVGFYFLNRLLFKFPDQDIIQISQTVIGRWGGTLTGGVFFLFFLTASTLLLRQFAESFIIAILPETPISVLMAFFIVLLIYGAIQGIETLSRVAWFFGPYLLLAFIVTILFSFPFADPAFLLPIFGKGIMPIMKHSFFHASLFSNIIMLGLIAPKIQQRNKVAGVGLFSILIAMVINVIVTMAVIMTFNPASAAHLIFPIFQLTRLITLGEFIQRVEAVFVFLWFFTAAILMGGLFYGTVISFSHTFGIKNHRPLVFAIGVLIFTLSLFPESMTETILLDDFIISKYYPLISFGLPFLLWIAAIITKKGRRPS